MDEHLLYPNWMLVAKRVVGENESWEKLMKELSDSVDSHLSEHHIPSLSDLSTDERVLITQRALKSISLGLTYRELYSKLALAIDQQVNNAVAKELLTLPPSIHSTKTDLILSNVSDGAVSILRRWPEMKSKVRVCLNTPLPPRLQRVVWQLFLSNKKVKEWYKDLLSHDPQKSISRSDNVISETCEKILKIQDTFPDIGPPSIGGFFAMKAVLSLIHAQQSISTELNNVYYLLILPFLQVFSPYFTIKQPAPDTVVAALVEVYFTFIRDLPKYIADFRDEFESDRRKFTSEVVQHLLTYEENIKQKETNEELTSSTKTLTEHIQFLFITQQRNPGEESLDTKQSTNIINILTDALLEIVSSLLKPMFVGFLNKELLMFVWDQYFIGLDVAGYHLHLLSAVTAVLLWLLQREILKCSSMAEMLETVLKKCHKIELTVVQEKMKQLHLKTLSSELNQDTAEELVDPTKVVERKWNHWANEIIPIRNLTSEERKKARDERQLERDRLLKLKAEEEAKVQEQTLLTDRLTEQRLRKAIEEENSRLQEETKKLEILLELERMKRIDSEQRYEEEIEKLRKEAERFRVRTKLPGSASILSYASVLAPPPSRVSLLPKVKDTTGTTLPAKRISSSKDPTADEIIFDLTSFIADSFNTVAHGKGQDMIKLNQKTKEEIKEHTEDMKHAEFAVFGRVLQPGEFDSLNDEEKIEKSQEMMEILKERLELRRETELKQ